MQFCSSCQPVATCSLSLFLSFLLTGKAGIMHGSTSYTTCSYARQNPESPLVFKLGPIPNRVSVVIYYKLYQHYKGTGNSLTGPLSLVAQDQCYHCLVIEGWNYNEVEDSWGPPIPQRFTEWSLNRYIRTAYLFASEHGVYGVEFKIKDENK